MDSYIEYFLSMPKAFIPDLDFVIFMLAAFTWMIIISVLISTAVSIIKYIFVGDRK